MWLCGCFPLFCFTDKCFILRPTVCVYFIVDLKWNKYSVGYYCWTIIAIKKLFIGSSCLQCNDVSHVYGTKVGALCIECCKAKGLFHEKVSSGTATNSLFQMLVDWLGLAWILSMYIGVPEFLLGQSLNKHKSHYSQHWQHPYISLDRITCIWHLSSKIQLELIIFHWILITQFWVNIGRLRVLSASYLSREISGLQSRVYPEISPTEYTLHFMGGWFPL